MYKSVVVFVILLIIASWVEPKYQDYFVGVIFIAMTLPILWSFIGMFKKWKSGR